MAYGQKYYVRFNQFNPRNGDKYEITGKIYQRGYIGGGGFVLSPAQLESSTNLLVGGFLISSDDGTITIPWSSQLQTLYGEYPQIWAYYNGAIQPVNISLNDTDAPTIITVDVGFIPASDTILIFKKPDISTQHNTSGDLTFAISGFQFIWLYSDNQLQPCFPILDDNDSPTSATIDLGSPSTNSYVQTKTPDAVLTYTHAEMVTSGGIITFDPTPYGTNAKYQVYYNGAIQPLNLTASPSLITIDLGDIPTGDTHVLILMAGGTVGLERLTVSRNPINIDFTGADPRNKMEPLKGSKAQLRILTSSTFDLETIYTDDEREYYLELGLSKADDTFTVYWSNNDNPDGNHVESFLQIYVNNILVIDSFTSESGNFRVNRGDTVTATSYTSGGSWPTAQSGLQLDFTGQITQRTTTYATPITVDNIPADQDLTIAGYSTYSDTDYEAIRSEIFYNSTSGYAIAYTKTYTGATQADADNAALADPDYTTEGQIYADAYPIGYPAIFRGFLIPDGNQQSWMPNRTVMELNFVDGIGLLKNLLFAQDGGDLFVGKLTPKDIIVNCLFRLGIPDMNIYTNCELFEESMDEDEDVLVQCLFQAETYKLSTQTKPLDCAAVLDSVLRNFGLEIRQNEGEWWVTDLEDQFNSGTHKYYRYSWLNGDLIASIDRDFTKTLGGNSLNKDLAYALSDQMKIFDRAYKGQIIRYAFKAAQNINRNPNLIPEVSGSGYIWPGWTVDPLGSGNVNPGPDNNGARMDSNALRPLDPPVITMTSEDIAVVVGDLLNFNFNFNNTGPVAYSKLQITFNNGADVYYLGQFGSWGAANVVDTIYTYNGQVLTNLLISPSAFYLQALSTDLSIEILAEAIPGLLPGHVNIVLFNYDYSQNDSLSAEEVNDLTYNDFQGTTTWNLATATFQAPVDSTGLAQGIFYTARNIGTSTFTPPILNVLNADDDTARYVGTIYREDETTPTAHWHRQDVPLESKQLLVILAETYVRMYQKSFRICTGTIMGWFPQLTRFEIESWTGKYMVASANYSLVFNQANLIQVSNEEIIGAPETVIETDYGQYSDGDLPTL